jgi:prepilin-type processing-associated H-X9-DG protein
MGDDQDIICHGGPNFSAPAQDTPGLQSWEGFGSGHSTGFGVVMCDGSVRVISYSIDGVTHYQLSNRCDGQPIDPTKY